MSDFLQAIRTVAADQNEQPALAERVAVKQHTSLSEVSPRNAVVPIQGPEDVLANLQSQPSEDLVRTQLRWLIEHASSSFDIRTPSTQSTSILRALINHTIPDVWSSSKTTQGLLLQCLSSLPGLRGLLSKLASVEAPASVASGGDKTSIYLKVLQDVLSQRSLVAAIWDHNSHSTNDNQRRLIWKDFSNIITSGRVVSTAAKYQDVSGSDLRSWLASGSDYASHLSRWIFNMCTGLKSEDLAGWDAATGLLSRGFALGYTNVLIEGLCKTSLEVNAKHLWVLPKLFQGLRSLDQKRLLDHLFPAIQHSIGQADDATTVSKVSALVSMVIIKDSPLWNEMLAWMQKPTATQTVSRNTRRAIVAVIGASVDALYSTVERNMQIFGENIFIRHAPPLEQEACGEMILLCAAQLNRKDPKSLKTLAHSSANMNGVSNRLNGSSQRARTLGMCVGMAISKLADGASKMEFDVEDVKTSYALNFMALADSQDRVGSIEDLNKSQPSRKNTEVKKGPSSKRPLQLVQPVNGSGPLKPSQPTGPRIVEVLSDDEDDLVPYAKPDSDPEDEDDDPTLINRDKQKAPVYIRDLMSGLGDDEKYDHFKLSLEHAAPLIRRKAQFGKEVSDHAVELSTILISLQDTFELDGFVELRLQALIAVLMSDPAELGPWFARQVFEGDYSLSQRGTILSAIGLAAREMAGLKDTDALNPIVGGKQPFPSKRLPAKYHAIYADEPHPSTPLQAISASLTDSIIAPLAAEAADSATGPTALKVRTFSSRLSASARTKTIPNALASILSDALFTPLAGHFYTASRAANTVFTAPFFLSTYLTTLAVLLHASGPATRALPQLTADFWALLLAARRGGDDHSVVRALLFGFLTILDVNADDTRRVATDHGSELVETHAWARDMYGRLPGGDDEADKLRGLAAGVLVKCGEVMEKWQRLLVGDMMDY